MQTQIVRPQAVLVARTCAVRPANARGLAGTPLVQRTVVTRRSQLVAARAAAENVEVEEIVKDLQAKWEALDNKPAFIVYCIAGFSAVWLSSTVINAINHLPLFPKLFELIGLGYSAWFTYRYLLFKSSREELLADIQVLKKKVSGEQ